MIKKVVLPTAGLGTRFLPLSQVIPKELLPLAAKPLLQYIIEEAVASGIKQAIFVTAPEKQLIFDYFTKIIKPEKIAQAKYQKHFINELNYLEQIRKILSFSRVFQKEPLGDGHAILQAEKLIGNNPFAVLFNDDIIISKVPCLLQQIKAFNQYKKPVLALYKIPEKDISFYGIVKTKKIANNLHKIEEIVEKPSIKSAPSNLAIIGKYVLTPDIFNYLKKSPRNEKKEILLAQTLNEMIKTGKTIYGLEIEGKWLECGNKLAYLKSNLYLSLAHPQFGLDIKKFLKEEKLP